MMLVERGHSSESWVCFRSLSGLSPLADVSPSRHHNPVMVLPSMDPRLTMDLKPTKSGGVGIFGVEHGQEM